MLRESCMSSAARPDLRVVEGRLGDQAHKRPDMTRLLLATFVVLAIATVVFAIGGSLTSVRRGVRALPEPERRTLLSRTVDELRQYCAPGRPEGLASHCHELASFASQFDECRGECETLVRRELTPVPTR
jgi:hypothetical protein